MDNERNNLYEEVKDYQDMSEMDYKRARRLRDSGAEDWVVLKAQDDASSMAALARETLIKLVNGYFDP